MYALIRLPSRARCFRATIGTATSPTHVPLMSKSVPTRLLSVFPKMSLNAHPNEPDLRNQTRGLQNVQSSSRRHMKCFSFVVEDGYRIELEDLKPWTKRLEPRSQGTTHPIVVFATVRQRHLLGSGPHEGVIDALIRQAHETNLQRGQAISVITGVVDRIDACTTDRDNRSSTEDNIQKTSAGAEGIAISNNLGEAMLISTRSRGISPGHIRFSNRTEGGLLQGIGQYEPQSPLDPGETRSITLSLAQTMMQTGTNFFLRKQTWVWGQDEADPSLLTDEPIDSVEFIRTTDGTATPPLLRLSAPVMFPITQPRRIHSSFGNVIQAFDARDFQMSSNVAAVPASHELEQRIDEFRKGLRDGGKGAEIWAAVKPGSHHYGLPHRTSTYKEVVENIVQQNMSMFRVHGGGGGWEGKGGPVTLDPGETSQQPTLQHDLSDEASLERYLSGADSLVKPGDVVQFYLIGLRKTSPNSSTSREGTGEGHCHVESRVTAGTLPCTADRVPLTSFEKQGLDKFGVLGEHATFSVELHAAKDSYDHGARKLGLLYKTNLPPSASFMLPHE